MGYKAHWLVPLMGGIFLGAWLKGLQGTDKTPPMPIPTAAVVETRTCFVNRPEDWETVYRYVQALSRERDAYRNRLTDQGDREPQPEVLAPTLEQQVLLERLEYLAHNAEQGERLETIQDYILNGPREYRFSP